MDKLGFVILHYNVMNETVNCVDSIRNHIDSTNYHIIIVDNHSPNHTGIRLKEYYSDDNRITVILNRTNDGFARGNNIGYKYALQELHCDFICVLNNDTLLIQDDFFRVIKEEYHNSRFGIMGPRIILRNGKTNFLYYRFPELHHFETQLKRHKRDYAYMKWHVNYPIVACKLVKNKVSGLFKQKKCPEDRKYQLFTGLDQRRENVILHGCCIVFSPEYAKYYNDAFDSRTFLYKEEELLYLRCKRVNLKIVYNPDLRIKHLEDMATNSTKVKKRKKLMFWLENQIQSLEILIGEIKQNE